jgi:glycosyltransferase involved in cell wall biosynthesis
VKKPSVRVAVVSDAVLPWHRGGKELRYQQLFTRWPSENLDVTVFTMKWWDDAPPPGPVTFSALSRRYPLYHGERRSIRQALMFALATFKMLWKKYDVIEADHMPYLQLFPLRIVASVRRVPLVVTWHEVWGRDYWREYLGPVGFIGAFIEWMATKLPSAIAVVSEGSAIRLRQMNVPARKIHIVPNALDQEELSRVTASPLSPSILAVGRLMTHKRVDLTLRALQQIPGETLGVIGSGPEHDQLVALSEELGITDRVTFFGDVADHEEVLGLMKGATVVSLPSEREGFGIAVGEALGVGTPVVTSTHLDNEARKLVSDGLTGSVIPAGDVAALVGALQFWLDATISGDLITERFWGQHRDLSWDSVAALYADLLRETL